jgi:hypothetical protein
LRVIVLTTGTIRAAARGAHDGGGHIEKLECRILVARVSIPFVRRID